ncbi:hypothetical protein [Nocardia blacklockiae]|uniref:hypothetical protein n=1 Tax=Nocardia blacklockiae TaxID=480036 RepID=UPI0018960C02|nr:hypothetical protein [Nocardia blacklockiae]MBF6173610.1 hypothetical protein [Nocardia blacklockiae]
MNAADDDRKMVTIRRAFRDLDVYLSKRVPSYHFDLDHGLAQLKAALRATDPRPPHVTEAPSECSAAEHCDGDPARAWRAAHPGPAGAYLAALSATPLLITSRNSDSFAARVAGGIDGERWLASWLPEMVLTRQQVLSAMVLNEILTVHDQDSATMLQMMSDLAADLHLPLIRILRRLALIQNPPPVPSWLRRVWSDDSDHSSAM